MLFQQALRVGKRVHAETDIQRAAPSLVSLALDRAATEIGPIAGKRVLVVGAGSMAGLAVATVTPPRRRRRRGRQPHRGQRPPARRPVRRPRRSRSRRSQDALADADVLVSCTGATGVVLPLSVVAAARADADRPLAIIDLALPHDVDPAVAELPGVSLFGLARLAEEVNEGQTATDVAAVREIVAQEIAAFLAARRSATVTPTVVALRTMATGIVDAEMDAAAGRGSPTSTPTSGPRSSTPCAGSPTSCCTSRPCGSRSWPTRPARCPTPPRWPSCSPSTPTPSRPSPGPEGISDEHLHASASAPGARCSPAPSPSTSPTALRAALGRDVELVEVTTEGDVSTAPLASLGGTGVFVGALRDALLRGDVDLAVHSLKDLPTTPHDADHAGRRTRRGRTRATRVVARDGLTLGELPAGARVGTGSPRRAAQLHALGLGFDVVAIRGNVDTRIGKVVAPARSTRSSWPAPASPGSDGSTR